VKLAILAALLATIPFLADVLVLLTLAFVASFAFFHASRSTRVGLVVLATTTLLTGTTIYALTIGGETLLALGPIKASRDGAMAGLAAMARLLLFLLTAHIGRLAIPGQEILELAARRPMAAYVVGTLVRLSSALTDDARKIHEAQLARGHDPGRGIRRARRLAPILVPLFVATLRRAQEQARALTLARQDARRRT
jgi:energy-coupling factor transport system permease protein